MDLIPGPLHSPPLLSPNFLFRDKHAHPVVPFRPDSGPEEGNTVGEMDDGSGIVSHVRDVLVVKGEWWREE